MSDQQVPIGMISAEEFAEREGFIKEQVISMVKNGFWVGRLVGDEWFVDKSVLSDPSNKSNEVKSEVSAPCPNCGDPNVKHKYPTWGSVGKALLVCFVFVLINSKWGSGPFFLLLFTNLMAWVTFIFALARFIMLPFARNQCSACNHRWR